MLKSKNLKMELASAALALTMISASPLHAQENDGFSDVDLNQIETVQVQADDTTARWTLDPYNPEIPEGVLWGMALLAAFFTLNAARNRMEGAWLRAGAAATAVAFLANPQIVSEQYQNLGTEALILVDVSESQSIDGRDILTAESLANLEENLANIGVQATIVEFGNEQGQAGTNISDAIQSTLNTVATDQLGAVFILSDGQIHDMETVMNRFDFDAPFHALISGEENEQDFRIQIETMPRYANLDEDLQIQYSIVSDHEMPAGDFRGSIIVRNNGEVVATLNALEINETHTLSLPELQRGDNNLEIELTHVSDQDIRPEVNTNLLGQDLSLENNLITAIIEGIGDVANVLMITGEPHQDTRYYREFLSSDPDINFVHFSLLRPPEREDETPLRYLATTAFPVHEVLNENIDEYDIIILDNYTYHGVIPPAYFDNIREFVEGGGSLFISGSESLAAPNGVSATYLNDILPLVPNGQVLEQSFVPQISDIGQRYPLSRNLEYQLPQETWGSWYSIAQTTADPAATVLLNDENGNPLLATQEYGAGRISVLASDQNWIWDRMPADNGAGPSEALTGNIMQWLLFNESMDEENIRLIPEGDRIIVELQSVSENSAEAITITTPSGQTIEVTPEGYRPGLSRAFIDANETGVYSAQRVGENADFAFLQIGVEDPLELKQVVSTSEYVETITSDSEGVVARMSFAPDIVPYEQIVEGDTQSMGVRMTQEQELSGVQRHSIPPWIPMLMITGLFAGALKREGGKSWKETMFGSKNKNDNKSDALKHQPTIE